MTVAVLRTAWGLERFPCVQLGSTGGSLKGVYRVGDRWLLKRYRADFRSFADVTAMHESQTFLARAGVGVATFHPTTHGDTAAVDEQGDAWVLYDWVDGAHPQPGAVTVAEAEALGDALARLDRALAGWQTDWPGAEPFQCYPAVAQAKLYQDLLHHAERGATPDDAQAAVVLRYRLGALERMAGVSERILALDRQWVHGDPNEGNILMRSGQVAAFLDFDNMRRAPRGFDFIYCLASCFPEAGPARDAFARAYLGAVRPAVAEVELWPALYAYWQICDIWPIDWRYRSPAEYDPIFSLPATGESWERQVAPLTDWLLSI